MSRLSKITDRGFKWYKPVKNIQVYESSNASEPCLWLNNELGGDSMQLTAGEALELAMTLTEAVQNHYQLELLTPEKEL